MVVNCAVSDVFYIQCCILFLIKTRSSSAFIFLCLWMFPARVYVALESLELELKSAANVCGFAFSIWHKFTWISEVINESDPAGRELLETK